MDSDMLNAGGSCISKFSHSSCFMTLDYSRGNEPQTSLTITGALTAAGGLVLLVLVASIMYVSIKCLKR